ncbi:hypothetical protein ACMD2_07178 [Ananas comosus]|uniref:Uncharacterized protein n=1 Tax=Ananas comosus TaxID=4615 RepID=A0A199W667_ANACO|nr:hypothetical protein ACMD2_07178 [Ananas comosus]
MGFPEGQNSEATRRSDGDISSPSIHLSVHSILILPCIFDPPPGCFGAREHSTGKGSTLIVS